MANSDKAFDKYFKERLIKHTEKPSALTWERLENRLPKSSKKSGFYFMGIAASLLLILGLGYLIWVSSNTQEPENIQLAEIENHEAEIERTPESEYSSPEKGEISLPEANIPNTQKENNVQQETEKRDIKPIQKQLVDQPVQLMAEANPPIERGQTDEISVPEISLPELDIQEALAQNTIQENTLVDDIGYSIKIVSNGIKDEPEKPGLIGEIENKIDKIGGILNKVDQGFADLQDAKNNLFASITTRKERNSK